MLRFFALCVVLAVVCVIGVVLAAELLPKKNPGTQVESADRNEPFSREENVEGAPAAADAGTDYRTEGSSASARRVRVIKVGGTAGAALPLIIPDARVLPSERIDVPSERDGKLLIFGTPVRPGEYVPKHKRLPPLEVMLLAVVAGPDETIAEDERIVDPGNPRARYRRPRSTDSLAPGTTRIVRQVIQFRKLAENDDVEAGQILGVINPTVALADMKSKHEKVVAAVEELRSSEATRAEAEIQYASIRRANMNVSKAVARDEEGRAKVTVERYKAEVAAKKSAIVTAQSELAAAWATLDMHVIRANSPGKIHTFLKQNGESVKNLEPVLKMQNTHFLKVEAQIEVQDALPLRTRLMKALALRAEADRLSVAAGNVDLPAAQTLRQKAKELVAVEIEASRPEPPRAVLSGHLQEVTCVAVTRGPLPRIVSGSVEELVRVWERVPGEDRWQEQYRLDHGAPIRALACAGPKGKKDILVTATSSGHVRVFDLGKLEAEPTLMDGRHTAAVLTVALSQDATRCATSGEDRVIRVWDTATGKLLGRKPGAHRSAVTSLSFTPAGRLISAGRDGRLVVWKLKDGEDSGLDMLEMVDEVSGRSADVAQLGLDPSGERVLFDEGRELRVLNLKTREIVGSLVNSGAAGSFSTMALFSPNDGQMILTNGNGPGRLQLWRAPTGKTRAAEMRQLLWSTGTVTCGAFDPAGQLAVTGTSDHRVLVWEMPAKVEANRPLPGELSFVEEFMDTSLKRVTVRATLENPGWVIPGAAATIVVPTKR